MKKVLINQKFYLSRSAHRNSFLILYSSILSSGEGVTPSLMTCAFLAEKGYCSPCQCQRRFIRPRHGMKKATMPRTRLKVDTRPQRNAVALALKPKKSFSMLRILTWRRIAVFRLHSTEIIMMTFGVKSIPKSFFGSCWKNVSSPPTVAVSVRVSRRRTICSPIW